MTAVTWAAAERNKGPILEVLRRVLPQGGRMVEVASGTGQHAVHFAAHLPGWTWLPTDPDPEQRASIAAWRAASGLLNLEEPVHLDVEAEWPVARADAVYCANMIHIAPWSATEGLMRGAAAVLDSGILVLYGPFLRDGVPTVESNLAFDVSLRERNPAWGLRRLEEVDALASKAGFVGPWVEEMPANNLLVTWRRGDDRAGR